MKRFRLTSIIGAILGIFLISTVVYAIVYEATIVVTSTSAYTMVPAMIPVNNTNLATAGYISATGLDTRVVAGSNTYNHMLAENMTLFTAPITSGSNTFTFKTGQTALSAFKIIPGYSGNITTADNNSLELGSVFDISISGYFDTSVGSGKDILFKDGAGRLDVSAASTITWHALNNDNSDNWTMTANPVASGTHTIRVYADGLVAYMYLDGSQTDTEPLYVSGIATTDAASGSTNAFPLNRGTAYSAGRYWEFYRKANNLWYTSSTDGSAWDAPIQLSTDNKTDGSDLFSTWFDGAYIHYARRTPKVGDGYMGYRRGTLVSDGTITWSAAEQSFTISDANQASVIGLAVDTGGYPYVSYSRGGDPYVLKSSTNDGTWSTAGGYPVSLGAKGYEETIIPLPAGKMYQARTSTNVVSGNKEYIYGRYYNGSSWSGSDETIEPTSHASNTIQNLTADTSGQVFTLWQRTSVLYLRVRSTAGSWGTIQTVFTNTSQAFGSLTYDATSNTVFIFYTKGTGGGNIFYKTFKGGVLGSEVQLTTGGVTDYNISSQFASTGGRIGIAFAGWALTSMQHAFLAFPWTWLDNGNDWTLMAGNSMSYADNITMDVGGARRLTYIPDSIITSSILPDESGNGNDGTFNWGTGLTGAMGPLTSGGSGGGTGTGDTGSGLPGRDRPDVLPEVNPELNTGSTAPVNPLSPIANMWADLWDVPDNVPWVLLAMLVVIGSFIGVYYKFQHLGAALSIACLFLGMFSIPTVGILPVAGLIVGIVGLIAGVVVEAKA
jgi:hypothetical protein